MHLLVYSAASLALLWMGLRWFERANLYFPDRTLTSHPGTYGIPYDTVWLKAADGVRLHGWFVEGEKQGPVLLFFHGNGGNISHRMDKLLIFRKLGASILIFDYRGYGLSRGVPTETGTYRDAEAAYAHLTAERRVPPGRIVFYGESLGCGVALELALRHNPRALILESALTSVGDMGRLVYPFLPVRWLVRFRYDNLAKIRRIRCPVLVMHSPEDEIVPYAMGRRLFEAAPEPKRFLETRGDHNEGFVISGEGYREGLRKFLQAYANPAADAQAPTTASLDSLRSSREPDEMP